MRAACIALSALALLVACGDDTTGTGGGGTTTATQSSTGGLGGAPPGSCVQPGDKGNANGVGEHCTPGGGQCAGFPLAPLCLADVGQDQWFCTRIGCDAMTDCGPDAGCLIEQAGSACVPCRCDDTGIGCAGGTTSATTTGAGGGGGAG